jgi:hypothetical protein
MHVAEISILFYSFSLMYCTITYTFIPRTMSAIVGTVNNMVLTPSRSAHQQEFGRHGDKLKIYGSTRVPPDPWVPIPFEVL